MSKGLGARQRDVLAKLAQHQDNPPDYDAQTRRVVERWRDRELAERYLRSRTERYPEWMTVAELAGQRLKRFDGTFTSDPSDVESTRRAVRKLEVVGLVETRWVWRHGLNGQRQLGVRLPDRSEEET